MSIENSFAQFESKLLTIAPASFALDCVYLKIYNQTQKLDLWCDLKALFYPMICCLSSSNRVVVLMRCSCEDISLSQYLRR